MTAVTDELDLQSIYNLSKTEAKVYRMRSEGFRQQEIADYLNVSLQCVKNTMVSIKRKVKEKEHPMQIITINQTNNGLMRRCTAEMCLRILQNDQKLDGLAKGKYTVSLDGISEEVGDTEFIKNEVFRYIEPRANNEGEIMPKVKAITDMYLQKGGTPGKMGYGWLIWVFERYYIQYDTI